ncbi:MULTISPECIES: hypothetical protein [Streptococcus]|uniref:hypothetical protein n=1 Tax=Streptococcus TaxID=1301 RepID=UPI001D1391DC|nr:MULTISPECIES: hypothetical protein [Streptococcus]
MVMGIVLMISHVSGRDIADYDVTIPRFGAITTGRVYKENSSNGVNRNYAIGGNKRMTTSIRLTRTGGDITPSLQMSSGSRIILRYNGGGDAYAGSTTTLALATPLTTVVRVQAQGSWSPDEW